MLRTREDRRATAVEDIVGLAKERLRGTLAKLAEPFIRCYFRRFAVGEIEERDNEALFGAALSLLQVGLKHKAGQPLVRVFNPRYEDHGWHTRHTVIEVVHEDMPFLVDSVTAGLNSLGLTVHLTVHPVMAVGRDAKGKLTSVQPPEERGDTLVPISFMHIEVDEHTDKETLEAISRCLTGVLSDVRVAVEDWRPMRARLEQVRADLDASRSRSAEHREAVAFLKWLENDQFTFLGYREYHYAADGSRTEVSIPQDVGLGVLRDPAAQLFNGLRRKFETLPEEVQAALMAQDELTIAKADMVSTVHRTVPMDAILIKRKGEGDTAIVEHAFAGLFTSAAYNRSARDIPYIRRKVVRILELADIDPASHDGKALANILDTYPRDELFQAREDELLSAGIGILDLQERQRTALFIRRDPFERFVTCLAYVPRERYDTELRRKLQAILADAFDGDASTFFIYLGGGVHARIEFTVRTVPGEVPPVDEAQLEHITAEASRGWTDHLRDALVDAYGEERGLGLHARYRRAFGGGYREGTVPQIAAGDIGKIETVLESGGIALNLYRSVGRPEHQVSFKFYHAGAPVALSDTLPMLEDLGLRAINETPHVVEAAGVDMPAYVHDFDLETWNGAPIDISAVKVIYQEAFMAVWAGEMESDGLNRLVVGAGLPWRQVMLLRAYSRYLRQARLPFSQEAVEGTLAAHPDISALLLRLFDVRFNPGLEGEARAEQQAAVLTEIEQRLEAVDSLEEDQIIRRFVNAVTSTLRTNAFQMDGQGNPKSYVSLKLDSTQVDGLPLPRPWREIFVYSPRVEAVHLRGGPVARGGIRWSDRREDFRTEILGLMKAQMVKNAVIVPVGSKGGFVVKRPPQPGEGGDGRAAFVAEGIDCYKTMMRGLLDITDNRAADGIVAPEQVVRWDSDDPYLVVAADKGTATFSDIANGISVDYGFWLGDAFASGGSAGYDHKKMGITARGAWESVKRHFREMGTDIQSVPFTVVGIGDMSGDVFGNGMLLSEQIKLVAAFNHRHIFIDPDPDPAVGYAERQRLFELGRGSWDAYDTTKLSAGGAVYGRDQKSLTLSGEIRALLGLQADKITPAALISTLLKAEVDLLWFGGIGTFIKSAAEANGDVGDKGNDNCRIDAIRMRAKVLGEGANLAITQRGRIEFARAGGRINTDSIDNSAGVDCSDHEVNIKVLLGAILADGDMTMKQRNRLLESMTDRVSELVLRDNYLQTQALTMTMVVAPDLLESQAQYMRFLEKSDRLDRAIEMLPDDESLTELLGHRDGLSRPEQCVLLAYSKINLYDRLLASNLPDDPVLNEDLIGYFPEALRQSFESQINAHTLRREIIATTITNMLVNRTHATFVYDLVERTGMGSVEVARAFLIIQRSFRLEEVWTAIEGLDNLTGTEVQTRMLMTVARLVDRGTDWVLRLCGQNLDIATQVDYFAPGIEELGRIVDSILYDRAKQVLADRVAGLIEEGVPAELAARVSALNVLAAGLDLIRIADRAQASLSLTAPIYFQIGDRLGIARLRDDAVRIKTGSRWQKQAVAAMIDDLYALQADLTAWILGTADKSKAADDLIEDWIASRQAPVDRIDQLMSDIRAMEQIDLSVLAVANRRLRGLIG